MHSSIDNGPSPSSSKPSEFLAVKPPRAVIRLDPSPAFTAHDRHRLQGCQSSPRLRMEAAAHRAPLLQRPLAHNHGSRALIAFTIPEVAPLSLWGIPNLAVRLSQSITRLPPVASYCFSQFINRSRQA